MTKSKPLFLVAIAVASLTMVAGQGVAQDCTSCGTVQSVGQDVFGYPSGGMSFSGSSQCGSLGCGSFGGGKLGSGELKARHQHQQQINNQIAARNNVWPKPFSCADRQLYFRIFEPMIDQGFEDQCVLTSAHFTDGTHELNRFGVNTVAGIMQNMPSHRKKVFIHRDVDQSLNQQRMAAVENTIKTYYGQLGPARVAYSDRLPVKIRGTTAANIDQKWLDGMQNPVIPISTGQGVAAAVGGG